LKQETNIKKTALVLGVLGQMGSFLAELLYSKGYEVHGVVRKNTSPERIEWIKSLVPNIAIYKIDIAKTLELSMIINNLRPECIYNFIGVTNTFQPWADIDSVLDLNAKFPQRILETIVTTDKNIRYFQASSCLVFGKDKTGFQNEATPRSPLWAYGASKNYADNIVMAFRDSFGLFACSGILFPTESSRRGEGFFTRKVAKAVAEIKMGVKKDKLKLGDISHMRDWMACEDAVDAIYRMMTAEKPEDYVIGSGVLTSTEFFVREAFAYQQLDYMEHIEQVPEFTRKKDMWSLCANNKKIKLELKWQPKVTVLELIKQMVEFEMIKIGGEIMSKTMDDLKKLNKK